MATVAHRTRFFDHRLPSLYAGRYAATVSESIEGLTTGDTLPERVQRFDVRQPRFSIAASEVQAAYPVPGAIGTFSQILPHITLDAPALPWARPLKGTTEGVPWVALLLFGEDELPGDREAVGQVTVSTVTQLLDGQAGEGRPPAIDRDHMLPGEAEEACRSILVPAELFTAILPEPAELALLAHIREGGPPDADHQRVAGSDPEPLTEDLNAVVVANRFPPAAGGQQVVHLVSLEGFEPYVTGTTPPAEGLRLVSLQTWSFETLPDSGIGFGDVVENLAAATDTLLRLPIDPGNVDGDVPQRLASGATALPQRLESGERTFAFYRGPLTATPAQELPAPAHPRLESAGEALIYLQQHGVFDTGYASAFSLGRALALADAPFRNRLLEFRKAARRAVRRLATRPELVTAARSVRQAADQLNANPQRTAFDRLISTTLPAALARTGAELAGAAHRPAQRTAAALPLAVGDLRAQLASEHVRELLQEATGPEREPVEEWLTGLSRLGMVPFDHLVPDLRMLPPESVRFGYLDAGWVRAAVDGALSVGVGHALDADLNALAATVPAPSACAVLIRSELIPNWPRTIITAFAGEDVVDPVHRLRYGNDVLLLLYPQVIDTFTLAEPPQGLHFGIGDVGTIELRRLTGEIGDPMGDFPQPPGFARFLRPGGHDVLDVAGTLAPELAAAHQLPSLSPAQFALQMIKAPQLQTFVRP
ncbi:hypothetical protein ACFVTF_05965 [Kitasatospora sp. NPDC057940]|uniref:hypothetical protein n=1 Tax=Kitasatospora sp. NPDC057940 TaxID=3346285 RepID=UPI0036DCC74C